MHENKVSLPWLEGEMLFQYRKCLVSGLTHVVPVLNDVLIMAPFFSRDASFVWLDCWILLHELELLRLGRHVEIAKLKGVWKYLCSLGDYEDAVSTADCLGT